MIYQESIIFYCPIVFYCVNTYILFIQSPDDGPVDCFQFGAIMNSFAKNISMQVFVNVVFYFSWVDT